MPKENHQKIKLLKLYELLQQESTPENALTTKQLTKRLQDMNISCDRRTLSKDIALLNEFGYEIKEKMQGHNKAYYAADQNFSFEDLKYLIHLVHGFCPILSSDKERLISKLASLGGSRKSELL